MSTVESLVLNAGPIRNRLGGLAAGLAVLELLQRLRTVENLSEALDVIAQIARTGADLTATTTDDELVATLEKYVNTPEAAALLEAGVNYWKSIKAMSTE